MSRGSTATVLGPRSVGPQLCSCLQWTGAMSPCPCHPSPLFGLSDSDSPGDPECTGLLSAAADPIAPVGVGSTDAPPLLLVPRRPLALPLAPGAEGSSAACGWAASPAPGTCLFTDDAVLAPFRGGSVISESSSVGGCGRCSHPFMLRAAATLSICNRRRMPGREMYCPCPVEARSRGGWPPWAYLQQFATPCPDSRQHWHGR